MVLEGGCRCGAVRYTLEAATSPSVYACHCHQCQRWSGSAFSLQALIPEASLSVSVPIVTYEKVADDRTSTQRICGTCHSRIYNTNTRRPGVAVLRAGTLDETENLHCKAHIFTTYKQAWVILPGGSLQWPEMPPPSDFISALMN